jgi:hypothetical protein
MHAELGEYIYSHVFPDKLKHPTTASASARFTIVFREIPSAVRSVSVLAPTLGVSLLGQHGSRVTQVALSLLMAIPRTSRACGTTLRGTDWRTACEWCMLRYGPMPGVMGFIFGAAGQCGHWAALKRMETLRCWEVVKSSMYRQSHWTTLALPGDLCRNWSRLTWRVASTKSYVAAQGSLRVNGH